MLIIFFFRLVEMTFGLVHARYNLPEWQASCKTDFLCTLLNVNLADFFYLIPPIVTATFEF